MILVVVLFLAACILYILPLNLLSVQVDARRVKSYYGYKLNLIVYYIYHYFIIVVMTHCYDGVVRSLARYTCIPVRGGGGRYVEFDLVIGLELIQ